MEYFEMLLLVLGVVLPFVLHLEKLREHSKLVMIIMISLLFLHLIFEGPRWQMVSIYLIYILCIFLISKGFSFFKGGWFRKITSGIVLIVMLILGYIFPTVFPVFDLPSPTGEYQVGARYMQFISDSEELITEQVGDKRELMIKAWYPASVSGEQREPYLNEAGRKGFAMKYNLPQNTFGYLDKIKTNTFQEPAVAKGTFPILIFSHGYNSNAFGYYALLEEIVSHGFIVLNINHTYESVGSQFPSGEQKFYDKEYDRKHNNEEMAIIAWNASENLKKATNIEEKKKAIDNALKNYFAAEISKRWEKDISEIVSQIPKWAETSFMANHMDESKIGLFGHSQGGSAVGQVLLDNPQIKAAINIDGVQWGELVDQDLNKPFLLLSSDWTADHPDFNEVAYYNSGSEDFYVAKIKNSGHSNFMDIPFMINLPMLNEAGSINPENAIEITSELVVDFFTKYLNQGDVNLLELSDADPELEIKVKSN